MQRILEAIAHENYKRSSLETAGILASAIGCAKKLAVSESRESARGAYFGKITNIGSGRTRKLKKKRSQEGRDISVHDGAHENYCPLRIARNRLGSIFRPNNNYGKRSRMEIIKGELVGGPGY